MFTGIIEATAEVLQTGAGKLAVARPTTFDDLKPGSSVSVAGVCLTVSAVNGKTMSFDVTEETLSVTTLGSLKKRDRVNLERALKAGDRIGGHVVQGHVEGVGEVASCGLRELILELPTALLKNITHKGSIAIDGISLTVARIDGDEVVIALIPHTIENTTLGSLKSGDKVNIETDVLNR